VDELLAGCENLSKDAGGHFREQTRQRGDEATRIESGEHSHQARRGAGRRTSWEQEPNVRRAEGLASLRCRQDDDVVEP